MSQQLVVAPLVIALVTAILTLITRKYYQAQVTLSLLGSVGYVLAIFGLARAVLPDHILTYQLSQWPAPYGITLVADALSVFMLGIAGTVSIVVLLFSLHYVDKYGQQVAFHPLYHFMLVGVSGAFLTGDLFNLFVWFEVMLMSSYILVVFYSGKEHTKAALHYVVINLIGSALMLLAIGGLYAVTGTLNMADLAVRLANPEMYNVAVLPVLGLSTMLFVVFALKAGMAPFQFWVPSVYRAAPAPISAIMAGVTKKVGVYAIIRIYVTVLGTAALPSGLAIPGISGSTFLAFFGPLLFIMAAASIVVGGLGAVSRTELDELLAYSSIGQIGFIMLPLAIAAAVPEFRGLAIAATLVYALNHALAKSLLFLTSGAVYETTGSTLFKDLGGLTEKMPVVSGAFFLGALSLIGIPPLLGFFGKMLVFNTFAGVAGWLGLGTALFGAIFTILYFSRAWSNMFWGEPGADIIPANLSRIQVGAVVLFAVIIVALGIGVNEILELANMAADAAMNQDAYTNAVLGDHATGGGH